MQALDSAQNELKKKIADDEAIITELREAQQHLTARSRIQETSAEKVRILASLIIRTANLICV